MKDFGSPYTEAEDDYLKLHYSTTPGAKLAKDLKRSLSSTQNRIRHLGLSKARKDEHGNILGKIPQKKLTVFLELDLVARIDDNRGRSSMSGYIQELVRRGLPRKGKAA